MWFSRVGVATLVLFLGGLAARAETLTIDIHDSSATAVHDIQWDAALPSPTMVVGIENPTPANAVLYGWQLGLTLVPDATATGTLQFNSATLPSSYLLAGRSGGLVPTFAGPSATISVIGDTDSQFTGVSVPASGKNLLQLDFTASSGASGKFYLQAVPDLFNGSNWYSSDFNAQAYANVPFGGGAVTLGSITVVPEPSTIALLLIAAIVLAAFVGRGRAA